MKKYSLTKDPVFNEEIMIPETGEPGHADIINAAPKQIFENTLFNREEIREGDSKDRKVTFDSKDNATANAWTNVPVMEDGETHKSLFEKISTMLKNLRFLYKLLGSADLSAMGDGTVTGALAALKPYCFVDPVDHLLANIKGKPLDATQGPVLKEPLDAVTQLNVITNPASKNEVLEFINALVPKFNKSATIPFNIHTSDGALEVKVGAYTGSLTIKAGVVSGILLNAWDVSTKLYIVAVLYLNPQTITINEFTDVPDLPAKIDQINSDMFKVYNTQVNLSTANWTTSSSGKFYTDVNVPDGEYLAISITFWSWLKPENNIVPYIMSKERVGIMSNTTEGFSNEAKVGLKILYR